MSQTREKSAVARARLILPIFLSGVAIAGIGFFLRAQTTQTALADDVRSRIHEVVINGGFIGPLHVVAGGYDETEDRYEEFQAETDAVSVAARYATLEINAATDTFTFRLEEVGVVRVPAGDEEFPVVFRDHYLLGPFPLREDVVDSPSAETSSD